jgi:hypothetical protein
VAITTSYGLGQPEIDSRKWQKTVLYGTASRQALGPTQFPAQWVPEVPSQGVKRLGHEADHSPPTSVEVKNSGDIPPFPNMSSWRCA